MTYWVKTTDIPTEIYHKVGDAVRFQTTKNKVITEQTDNILESYNTYLKTEYGFTLEMDQEDYTVYYVFDSANDYILFLLKWS